MSGTRKVLTHIIEISHNVWLARYLNGESVRHEGTEEETRKLHRFEDNAILAIIDRERVNQSAKEALDRDRRYIEGVKQARRIIAEEVASTVEVAACAPIFGAAERAMDALDAVLKEMEG